MNKPVIWIVAGVFVMIISIGMFFNAFGFSPTTNRDTDAYTIVEKWELPEILTEVSDISWIDKDVIAAVQDEDGIIFFYNLKSSKIIKKINFSGSGDYEGMAIDANTLYVVRSDGKIFKIENFKSEKFTVTEYETPLTEKQNIEGLALDKKNNRLLLSIKGKETGNKNYKGIYGFDLATKKLQKELVYRINFDDPIFKKIKADKKTKIIRPSEIAIHPKTGQLFVLDAKIPMLVIFGANGNSQKIYFLKEDEFAQPEGFTFDSLGNLYISNEGAKGPGNILQVALKK